MEETEEEIAAQRKDYEWYVRIVDLKEPSFRSPTYEEVEGIYDSDWDASSEQYTELYENKNRTDAE